MWNIVVCLLPVCLVACSNSSTGDASEGEGDTAVEGEGEEGEGDGEGDEGEGEEGEGEPGPLDCNAPLNFDVNRRSMPGVRAYHGIAFASDNTLVAWDPNSGNVEKTTRAGQTSLFVPSVDGVEQIETTPNGDLLLVQSDQLLRVNANGSSQRIGGDLGGGYGVTIGPDGNAYVSGYGGVFRVDLSTGDMVSIISPQTIPNAHDVDFSLDSSTMYVATISSGLWSVAVDEDLTPIGQPVRIANSFNGWMDAVVVDECGYLWVPVYDDATLHRINPTTGDDNVSQCSSRECYTHGVTFGVDAAGWNHRALYMPRPYAGGEAVEIEVGIRDGKYARTFRGVPQPVPPDGPREMGGEDCDNGSDDDGDFVIDCNDTDCDGAPACAEVCGNGVDDDGDFIGDCTDSDCDIECVEICDNNIDDDEDFQTDCEDGACQDSPLCVEICANDIDDDNDGLMDCTEPSCFDPVTCVETCGNGSDDDDDFETDCVDRDCEDSPLCVEICGNGIDDDDDGRLDCAEASCFDPITCVEICDNQSDDDQDFAVDCADNDCLNEPACAPPVVTIDLGDRNNPTAVTLPFSEGVANEGGEECIEFTVETQSVLVARTQSPACQANTEDTFLELFSEGASVFSNDDNGTNFCSVLNLPLTPAIYQLCVRSLGNQALQPVLLVASITPQP
jgi:hypothetical protein